MIVRGGVVALAVSMETDRALYNLGLAHNVAKYFGDPDAVPGGMCGKCT